MTLNKPRVRHYLKSFKLEKLFIEELGWDRHSGKLPVDVDGVSHTLKAIAEKKGVQIFQCRCEDNAVMPDYAARRKIEKQATQSAYEHLIIFIDAAETVQIWQWVSRQPSLRAACREHHYYPGHQSGDALIQKIELITFSLSEEEGLTLAGTTFKLRDAFDRDKVTKKFYDHFKNQHHAFLEFIKGITEKGDREWYASLMLNRLMFIYFIQKKGFLDGDTNYLQNRLDIVIKRKGKGKFHSFYRYFLLRLFHEGFAQQPERRKKDLEALLGKVPYLNGGLFDLHELEQNYSKIDIPDEAFEKLFAFFDQYEWHLDNRPLSNDKEINPDVLGYIFEKYINQKQMGAYYTKEDITEYISKNTIIPYLFDAARKKCAIAFRSDSAMWQLLKNDPLRYIYPAMRRGVFDKDGDEIPLPDDIAQGVDHIDKRGEWNQPADGEYALPTEIWREHMARRQRCLEIRDKLLAGEIHQINDLITYNLDIRQFAEDVIVDIEGPELLRAFYKAISTVSLLDPTCGSGAFLFAALNILEPLYDACLDRMQGFIDDLDQSGKRHRPEKFSDFRKVLNAVDEHPNRRFFILKSIVVNNLYGVDIMEEAVEICKLRLFLKLVAQVDKAKQLEPLPDIDFNIRSGNTLVGYVSVDEIRKAAETDASGQTQILLEGTKDDIGRIEEDAGLVEKAFNRFHELQTRHRMDVDDFRAAKDELRNRLEALSDQLDHYLAKEYGIDPSKKKAFESWRASHQTFHWFVEFFGIMNQGGFNVVIGNPPYIELRTLNDYEIAGYKCLSASNLYAIVVERACDLSQASSWNGFIVPVSSVSTDRYKDFQTLLTGYDVWYSSFDDRPSRLFEGLEHVRLTIHLIGNERNGSSLFSTRYNKWNSGERTALFENLIYVESIPSIIQNSFPKFSSNLESEIISKISKSGKKLSHFLLKNGKYKVYYSRKVGYYLQVLDFQPLVLDGSGFLRPPSEFKTLYFDNKCYADACLCHLNSNLFYWFITIYSDCRHVNKREVVSFPIDLSSIKGSEYELIFNKLSMKLMDDIKHNSQEKIMNFKHDSLTVQCIIPKLSKRIIDEIDLAISNHYGLNDEEIDFIRNYDIKYRMGI